jgi:hypothetical protein
MSIVVHSVHIHCRCEIELSQSQRVNNLSLFLVSCPNPPSFLLVFVLLPVLPLQSITPGQEKS